MSKIIEITNKKFSRWTVLHRGSLDKHKKIRWVCRCECGTVQEVNGKTLRNGMSKGCRKCMKTNRTHGLSRTSTYTIWIDMIRRCHNPKDTSFKWYGAKGIYVCDDWRNSFINFLTDMGERPVRKSIDRIDNFKGYYKENCRWASTKEQNLNKRIHQNRSSP